MYKKQQQQKINIYEHELLWLYNFWSIECPKKTELKLTNKKEFSTKVAPKNVSQSRRTGNNFKLKFR